MTDIDIDRGTFTIRHGKGDKDRMIPIGKRAVLWIEKYLYEVMPELVIGMSDKKQVHATCSNKPWQPSC